LVVSEFSRNGRLAQPIAGGREQAKATANGAAGNRAKADQFAANIVPVVRDINAAGIRTLKGVAGALNARGVRTGARLASGIRRQYGTS
jgi:hypothetical protein